MNFLRSIKKIQETAVVGSTSAGSIAGVRGSLFGRSKLLKRRKSVAKVPVIKFKHEASFEEFARDRDAVFPLLEYNRTDVSKKYDQSDIISKITAKERLAKAGENSVVFGLEDDKGQITRVYVQRDQGKEFEQALSHYFQRAKNKSEIAEVLFELKNRFNITNIIWPRVEEDEEPAPSLDKGKVGKGKEGAGDEMGDDLGLDAGNETGEDSEEDGLFSDDLGLDDKSDSGSFDASGTIDKIIDMLTADIDAKKAEARAREEEAKAKEAEMEARAAEARIKAEEDVLDMESHFKKGRDEDKEAKKLAKLAQYRHELKRQQEEDKTAPGVEPQMDADVDMSKEITGVENEEMVKSLKNFLRYNQKNKVNNNATTRR